MTPMPTITAEQRNALSQHVQFELPGLIEGLWPMIGRGDYVAATQRALELSDVLRFVADDLGWGERRGNSIESRSPKDVLKRVSTRLLRGAATVEKHRGGDWEQAREEEAENQLVKEACSAALAELDQSQPPAQRPAEDEAG